MHMRLYGGGETHFNTKQDKPLQSANTQFKVNILYSEYIIVTILFPPAELFKLSSVGSETYHRWSGRPSWRWRRRLCCSHWTGSEKYRPVFPAAGGVSSPCSQTPWWIWKSHTGNATPFYISIFSLYDCTTTLRNVAKLSLDVSVKSYPSRQRSTKCFLIKSRMPSIQIQAFSFCLTGKQRVKPLCARCQTQGNYRNLS